MITDVIIGKSATPFKATELQRRLHNNYQYIASVLLYNAGLRQPVLNWAFSQAALETSGFTHIPAKGDRNLSGIMWINKPYQKNATKGRPMPENKGYFYAKFDSYQDWANDFVRILKIGGANAPINATSLADYVRRLKANNYFKSSEQAYLNVIRYYDNQLPEAMKVVKNDAAEGWKIEKEREANAGFKGWFNKLPWYGQWGLGAVAALAAVNVVNNLTKR